MHIIAGDKWIPGIYHYSHAGLISWFDLAKAIAEMTGASCTVNPVPTTQFPTPAKRPAYSAMDTSKIIEVYGVITPDWRSQLSIALEKIKKHL